MKQPYLFSTAEQAWFLALVGKRARVRSKSQSRTWGSGLPASSGCWGHHFSYSKARRFYR